MRQLWSRIGEAVVAGCFVYASISFNQSGAHRFFASCLLLPAKIVPLLPDMDNASFGVAPPRVLIVRVGAMGDVLHGMPAVAALRAAMPKAFIAWAIEPRWAPLLRVSNDAEAGSVAMPLVDCVHLVPAKAWSKAPLSLVTGKSIAGLRRELRDGRYDIAVDLQGTIRSSVIAKMTGAARVIGNDRPREGAARWLFSERVPTQTPHVVEQAAELLSHALGNWLVPAVAPLPIDADAEDWCDGVVPPQRERTVFLAPTAGWGAKQWPVERYGAIAQALNYRGCRVLVNAAPGGDAVADAVVAASGGTAEAVPSTLPQMIAVLRRVALVIAGDSGPLHLAAALNVPVVALFGPTDPARNGPWGTEARVLRHALSVTNHRRHAAVEAGLAQITADEVLAAALEMLGYAGSADLPAGGADARADG
jgi:heptosyltransferase-1